VENGNPAVPFAEFCLEKVDAGKVPAINLRLLNVESAQPIWFGTFMEPTQDVRVKAIVEPPRKSTGSDNPVIDC
jgi:hypothetical protein